MAEIIDLFPKKEDVKKSPEEVVENFHAKLDEVLGEFHVLNAMEKFEVMKSVIQISKDIFKLYIDLKMRTEI